MSLLTLGETTARTSDDVVPAQTGWWARLPTADSLLPGQVREAVARSALVTGTAFAAFCFLFGELLIPGVNDETGPGPWHSMNPARAPFLTLGAYVYLAWFAAFGLYLANRRRASRAVGAITLVLTWLLPSIANVTGSQRPPAAVLVTLGLLSPLTLLRGNRSVGSIRTRMVMAGSAVAVLAILVCWRLWELARYWGLVDFNFKAAEFRFPSTNTAGRDITLGPLGHDTSRSCFYWCPSNSIVNKSDLHANGPGIIPDLERWVPYALAVALVVAVLAWRSRTLLPAVAAVSVPFVAASTRSEAFFVSIPRYHPDTHATRQTLVWGLVAAAVVLGHSRLRLPARSELICTEPLPRSYALLLRSYPPSWHRNRRVEELLAIMLDAADAERRRRPTVREALDVIRHGLWVRLRGLDVALPIEVRVVVVRLTLVLSTALAMFCLLLGEIPVPGLSDATPSAFMTLGMYPTGRPFATLGFIVYLGWMGMFGFYLAGRMRSYRQLAAATLLVTCLLPTIAGATEHQRPPGALLVTLALLNLLALLPGRPDRASGRARHVMVAGTVAALAVLMGMRLDVLPGMHWDLYHQPYVHYSRYDFYWWGIGRIGELLVPRAVIAGLLVALLVRRRYPHWLPAVVVVCVPFIALRAFESEPPRTFGHIGVNAGPALLQAITWCSAAVVVVLAQNSQIRHPMFRIARGRIGTESANRQPV